LFFIHFIEENFQKHKFIDPFYLNRENDRNAKLIIKMDGKMTTIANPDTPSKYSHV